MVLNNPDKWTSILCMLTGWIKYSCVLSEYQHKAPVQRSTNLSWMEAERLHLTSIVPQTLLRKISVEGRTHPPVWCWFSFLSLSAWTVFSLLMLCKLFCLCIGFAWPSSLAVGTHTGRRSCINRLHCVRAAGREKGARVFLGLGWQSKAFSTHGQRKKGAFCFWGGGESKHSPTEHNEWAVLSCTVFHRNRIVGFYVFFANFKSFCQKNF